MNRTRELACLLRVQTGSELTDSRGREGFFPSMVGTEESRRAGGSRPTGIACDRIGLGSLALSTLHQRQPASTCLALYRYF